MFQRYFDKPYRFIAPYKGTFWCRLAKKVMPGHLRRQMRVLRWQFQGLDHLQASLDQGAGILLASNHCRWADPIVLGMLSMEVKRYFYYAASYHLFRQQRLTGWIMRRLGGFSILREGTDREALRACAEILANGERPLVLFPEGTWFRQNDRLGPLQEGVVLIARQALRQARGPVHVHPVAIKYWLLEDPRVVLTERLGQIERRLSWREQSHLDFVPRIEKLGSALLALKEIEHLGQPQEGCLDERVTQLSSELVTRVEAEYPGNRPEVSLLERIRRLRPGLVRQLPEQRSDPEKLAQVRRHLDMLLLSENLASHSLDYLHQGQTLKWGGLERLTETVQRIEETLSDGKEVAPVPLGASVSVGPVLDVRHTLEGKRGAEVNTRFLRELSGGMQELLDQHLAQGPPSEWACPAPWGVASANGKVLEPGDVPAGQR